MNNKWNWNSSEERNRVAGAAYDAYQEIYKHVSPYIKKWGETEDELDSVTFTNVAEAVLATYEGGKPKVPVTSQEWFGFLHKAPLVAGPWIEVFGEEQRVKTIMIRRSPKNHFVTQVIGPLCHPGGPYEEKDRTLWVASFAPYQPFNPALVALYPAWYLDPIPMQASMRTAMDAADKKLKDNGWLLCDG